MFYLYKCIAKNLFKKIDLDVRANNLTVMRTDDVIVEVFYSDLIILVAIHSNDLTIGDNLRKYFHF